MDSSLRPDIKLLTRADLRQPTDNPDQPWLWHGFLAPGAVSLFDRTHRATFTYVYDLPFLREQRGVLGRIAGGWQQAGIGQALALTGILIALTYWRTHRGFTRHAFATNAVVMACGFLLVGYQLSGYVLG